jgi:hypothetical protein
MSAQHEISQGNKPGVAELEGPESGLDKIRLNLTFSVALCHNELSLVSAGYVANSALPWQDLSPA